MLGIDNLATGRRENLARAEARGQAFTFAELDIRDDALLDLFERNQPAVLMRLAAQSGMRPSLEDPGREYQPCPRQRRRTSTGPRRRGRRDLGLRFSDALGQTADGVQRRRADP